MASAPHDQGNTHLVRNGGVRWGLPTLDNGDALGTGDPHTASVVSKLLLEPCCLLDPKEAGGPLPEELPGVALLLLPVCLSVAKASGGELRLSGDPAVVKELERRGSAERPCSRVWITWSRWQCSWMMQMHVA